MADLGVVRNTENQRVVLRLMKEEYGRKWGMRRKFRYGISVLAQLQHPNLVRLLDHGQIGKQPFMVTEYIEGRNIRELILKQDPLLTQNPLALIRQMAAVLYYIHAEGYIHLDFKPENLLVDENGRVVLIDFDLVRERKSKPEKIRKALPGTPAYIAPEVLSQRLVSEQADIFSFGVTAYEMVTRHKPFEATTLDEERMRQVDPRVPPTPLGQYNPQVPKRLESIILKCLAKSPDGRYPSMSSIVKDIEALV